MNKALTTIATGLGFLMAVPLLASAQTNMFGGPVYSGKPDLQATAALVKAGGGPENFEFSKALVSMLGKKTVNAEVAKLTKQYGKKDVTDFLNGATFVVKDALKHATDAGIKLPPAPSNLKGHNLASALVEAGTAPDGAWWSGYLLDKTLSHTIHNEVMADIDQKYSHAYDENAHKILNQAMYDVAHALAPSARSNPTAFQAVCFQPPIAHENRRNGGIQA